MPPRFNYVYIAAVVTILICLNIGLFFMTSEPPESTAPMPTAIDPSFLSQVNDCLIPVATLYGYTLRISSGWRSVDEQAAIYQQGRTVNGHIVTEAPAGKSIHNFGFAVDVADRWRGYDINWTRLAKIGSYCRLESDKDDPPHFEIRDGLTTALFSAGMRPLSHALPCLVMAERAKEKKPLTFKDLKDCSAPKF